MRPLYSSGVELIGLGQWWRLLPRTVVLGVQHFAGLGAYKLGRHGDPHPAPLSVTPPQTRWTDAAEQAASVLSDEFRAHSLRSWYFATALCHADKVNLTPDEREDLYVAFLLHDTGLFGMDRSRCFAATGGLLAQTTAAEAGVDEGRAVRVANAIIGHIDVKPPTPLAARVRSGTLLDIIGTGVWKIDPDAVLRACDNWPRDGFPVAARDAWLGECQLFRFGRAAYAKWPGLLLQVMKCTPLPD